MLDAEEEMMIIIYIEYLVIVALLLVAVRVCFGDNDNVAENGDGLRKEASLIGSHHLEEGL